MTIRNQSSDRTSHLLAIFLIFLRISEKSCVCANLALLPRLRRRSVLPVTLILGQHCCNKDYKKHVLMIENDTNSNKPFPFLAFSLLSCPLLFRPSSTLTERENKTVRLRKREGELCFLQLPWKRCLSALHGLDEAPLSSRCPPRLFIVLKGRSMCVCLEL